MSIELAVCNERSFVSAAAAPAVWRCWRDGATIGIFSCVLDGDHCLVGEGLDQLDLFFGKRDHLIAAERLMILSTSAVAICCSSASSRSRCQRRWAGGARANTVPLPLRCSRPNGIAETDSLIRIPAIWPRPPLMTVSWMASAELRRRTAERQEFRLHATYGMSETMIAAIRFAAQVPRQRRSPQDGGRRCSASSCAAAPGAQCVIFP